MQGHVSRRGAPPQNGHLKKGTLRDRGQELLWPSVLRLTQPQQASTAGTRKNTSTDCSTVGPAAHAHAQATARAHVSQPAVQRSAYAAELLARTARRARRAGPAFAHSRFSLMSAS